MIDNSILREKLENKLAKQNLDEEGKERLTSELNFLANFLIDVALDKKSNEQGKN